MKKNGFTLIELMIVVAIIGILASIAIPGYQTYVTRSQITESLVIVGELKQTVTEYYKYKGRFPDNNKQAGIPEARYLLGNYVEGIEISKGAFHVTLGNKINANLKGKIVTLRPIVVTGSPASPFSWACGLSSAPKGMHAIGENRTNVEKAFLPAACRF